MGFVKLSYKEVKWLKLWRVVFEKFWKNIWGTGYITGAYKIKSPLPPRAGRKEFLPGGGLALDTLGLRHFVSETFNIGLAFEALMWCSLVTGNSARNLWKDPK
jgi:hypothetical protein